MLHRPPPETRIFLPPSGVLSKRRTRRPAFAAKIAAIVPAAPAPTTTTECSRPLAFSIPQPYSIFHRRAGTVHGRVGSRQAGEGRRRERIATGWLQACTGPPRWCTGLERTSSL